MSDHVYIVSGCRSPIGNFQGAFSKMRIYDVTKPILQSAVERSLIDASEIGEIYVGNVLASGKGQNPARQAAFAAKLPLEIPSLTINQLCGSGMKAIILGYNSIMAGSSTVVLAAGMESMSQAEHSANLRNPIRIGDTTLKDTLLTDGLTDAMFNVHMGITAEEVVSQYHVTREEQDKYACESQRKCEVAIKNAAFVDEIVGVRDESKDVVIIEDEYPRPSTSLETLSKLKPAFKKVGGSVTAGNASGINDGAAAVMLCHSSVKERLNLKPLARIVGFSEIAIDPMVMGISPIKAIRTLMQKIQWTIADVDLFEINEPFAAQAIVVCKELGLDAAKVNVNGGAIALGHPIGSSGTRIIVTLMYALRRLGKRRGVAAICVGGGIGLAMAIEMC